MAVCDDTVQTNLVEIRRLELQHLVDAGAVDLIRGLADVLCRIIRTAKTRSDQLLAELVKQIERPEMSTAGDLNQLCETVANLAFGQTSQELEVEECVHRGVVRS